MNDTARTIETTNVQGEKVTLRIPSMREVITDHLMQALSATSDTNAARHLAFERGVLTLAERIALSEAVDALNTASAKVAEAYSKIHGQLRIAEAEAYERQGAR